MTDKKRVINEFSEFVDSYVPACTSEGMELELFKAVREILKEQPDVVRCKDCKHWEDSFSNGKYRFGMCGKTFGMIYTPEIHFCYDGERKEQTDDSEKEQD